MFLFYNYNYKTNKRKPDLALLATCVLSPTSRNLASFLSHLLNYFFPKLGLLYSLLTHAVNFVFDLVSMISLAAKTSRIAIFSLTSRFRIRKGRGAAASSSLSTTMIISSIASLLSSSEVCSSLSSSASISSNDVVGPSKIVTFLIFVQSLIFTRPNLIPPPGFVVCHWLL